MCSATSMAHMEIMLKEVHLPDTPLDVRQALEIMCGFLCRMEDSEFVFPFVSPPPLYWFSFRLVRTFLHFCFCIILSGQAVEVLSDSYSLMWVISTGRESQEVFQFSFYFFPFMADSSCCQSFFTELPVKGLWSQTVTDLKHWVSTLLQGIFSLTFIFFGWLSTLVHLCLASWPLSHTKHYLKDSKWVYKAVWEVWGRETERKKREREQSSQSCRQQFIQCHDISQMILPPEPYGN